MHPFGNMDLSLPLGIAERRYGLDPMTAMTRDVGDDGDLPAALSRRARFRFFPLAGFHMG
jgi:hypothetical protein